MKCPSTAAGGVRRELSRDRKRPARLRTPSVTKVDVASIKIATRNEFFSGQSVTCVEVGESEKISGKAARPSAVRARDVSSRARSPADRLARPDKKKRKGASECADVARRDRAGDRVPTRAERSPAFRRCGIA